jgi:hypothetical protein
MMRGGLFLSNGNEIVTTLKSAFGLPRSGIGGIFFREKLGVNERFRKWSSPTKFQWSIINGSEDYR